MKKVTKPDQYSGKKFWLRQPDGVYQQTAFGHSAQRQTRLRLILKQGDQFYWLRDDYNEQNRVAFMKPLWPHGLNTRGQLFGEWSLLEEGDEGWMNGQKSG